MDRTSKIIFAAIALGLWANIAIHFFEPKAVAAQNTTEGGYSALVYDRLGTIQSDVQSIEHDLHSVAGGICLNKNLCRQP
jgi:hypothetical protein